MASVFTNTQDQVSVPTRLWTFIALIFAVNATAVWEHTSFLSVIHTFCPGLRWRLNWDAHCIMHIVLLLPSERTQSSEVNFIAVPVGCGEATRASSSLPAQRTPLLSASPNQGSALLCLTQESSEPSTELLMTYAWSQVIPSGLPQGLDPSLALPFCQHRILSPWGTGGLLPITVDISLCSPKSSLCLVRLNCMAPESWNLWFESPQWPWGILRMDSMAPGVLWWCTVLLPPWPLQRLEGGQAARQGQGCSKWHWKLCQHIQTLQEQCIQGRRPGSPELLSHCEPGMFSAAKCREFQSLSLAANQMALKTGKQAGINSCIFPLRTLRHRKPGE